MWGRNFGRTAELRIYPKTGIIAVEGAAYEQRLEMVAIVRCAAAADKLQAINLLAAPGSDEDEA